MKKERVGYFGGTFDPPHLGHIILARETQFHLGLDAFWWILTPDPPHKKSRILTPVKQRLEMINLIVEEYGKFAICDVDLNRDPPHYAADTVEILKKQNPSMELVYIIGEDSLQDLPEWHDPSRFLDIVDQLAIAPRPRIATTMEELEKMLPGISSKVVFIPNVMLEISSSVIRERVRDGNPYEHFLTVSVSDYIRSNDLYCP